MSMAFAAVLAAGGCAPASRVPDALTADEYLAGEDAFAFVKNMQSRNLIVPLVGDFAGSTALAAAAAFARERGATMSVFYGSNVEVYLTREQTTRFCGNLKLFPYEARSWFVGSKGMRTFQSKLDGCR